MGLQDRDYVRRSAPDGHARWLAFPEMTPRPWWQRIKWGTVLPIAASAIAVLSGAVWLARDAMPLFGRDPPSEGSLLVNINTASVEQLETLPGIGPARARLIIEHRPYLNVDDLKRVSGVPDALVDDIRPLLLISGETQKAGSK